MQIIRILKNLRIIIYTNILNNLFIILFLIQIKLNYKITNVKIVYFYLFVSN